MFHPSSQHVSFRQQVIALSQSYPCPRCTSGMMEPYGFTETFLCNTCNRTFVPLKGGRFLYPARHLGWRIAPIFWWDGFRWHWSGTTATPRQLFWIVALSLLPVILVNLAICLNWWTEQPRWCNPVLLSPSLALTSIQVIYFLSWDFKFLKRKRS
ncbi:MAG: hypothetical protein HY711_00380 [Candidatus Melainabacteria bacterium]|nr:hypothetical protein [Candidatus Melainabacteria bacterium]